MAVSKCFFLVDDYMVFLVLRLSSIDDGDVDFDPEECFLLIYRVVFIY